jgi:hypothetical protein
MAGPVGQQNTTSLSWRVRVFPADDVSNMSGSERDQAKGDRVKFPSHPKRMTTTPHQELRWVKREIAGNLAP